jgi:phospholipase/lecithinase/hemolysin
MLMRLVGILAYPLCVLAAPNAQYRQLFVFGDSYSDSGAGYVDGNGPTAVVYLGQHMGLKLAAAPNVDAAAQRERSNSSLNFAVSGAQTGAGAGRRVGAARLGYGMRNQVDDFAELVRKGSIAFQPESTLFFIAGGLNDRRLPSETTVANLLGEMRTLYGLGARHFRLARLPEAIPEFREVGLRLNPELEKIPQLAAREFAGIDVRMSDWGRFMDEVRLKPESFGIANITQACAGRAIFKEDTKPCDKPDAFFYYHAGHPSTAVHKIVGRKLYEELSSDK